MNGIRRSRTAPRNAPLRAASVIRRLRLFIKDVQKQLHDNGINLARRFLRNLACRNMNSVLFLIPMLSLLSDGKKKSLIPNGETGMRPSSSSLRLRPNLFASTLINLISSRRRSPCTRVTPQYQRRRRIKRGYAALVSQGCAAVFFGVGG